MSIQLKVGDIFEVYGASHRIHEISATVLRAQRTIDRCIIEYNVLDLIKEESFSVVTSEGNTLISPWSPDFDALDKELQDQIRDRYELIEPLVLYKDNYSAFENKYPDLAATKGINIRMIIKTIIERRDAISERTLWRHWTNWKKDGFKGLINMQGKGVNKRNSFVTLKDPNTQEIVQLIPCRLTKEQVKIVEEEIQSNYFKALADSKEEIFKNVKAKCEDSKIGEVAKTTLYRILGSIEKKYLVLFRYGLKEYRKEFGAVMPRTNRAQVPLQVVQVDHTLLDIDVLDDERIGVVGRPYITLGLDEYSRMPWCVIIGWEPPSAKVLAKAIIQGVFPKNVKEEYGTTNDWEIFGVPQVIFCDNAKEFHSKELERIVCQELKGELRFRPPGQPHYSGAVERFFGTLNTELIHNIEGTRKSNPKQLNGRNPEKEACLTMSELRKMIMKYIVDMYQHSEHKGLPKEFPTPFLMYQQGIQRTGLPRIIPISEKENFSLRMLPEETRKICREGIQLNNIFYASNDTTALVGASNQRIKYDPYDVSCIYLLHAHQEKWVKVPAIKPAEESLEGLTLLEWVYLEKTRREKGKTAMNRIEATKWVLREREELKKIVESSKKKTRVARRKVQAIKTTGKKVERPNKQITKKVAEERLKELSNQVPKNGSIPISEFVDYTSNDNVPQNPVRYQEW